MLRWFQSLLRKHTNIQNNASEPGIAALEASMRQALLAKVPAVRAAFSNIDITALPQDMASLHLEVFDESDIEMRAFAIGPDGEEVFSKARQSALEHSFTPEFDPDEPMDVLNKSLGEAGPIISADLIEPYLVWDDDPKYGRTLAITQPSDLIDRAALLRPWLSEVTAPFREQSGMPVKWCLHDIMQPEEISA